MQDKVQKARFVLRRIGCNKKKTQLLIKLRRWQPVQCVYSTVLPCELPRKRKMKSSQTFVFRLVCECCKSCKVCCGLNVLPLVEPVWWSKWNADASLDLAAITLSGVVFSILIPYSLTLLSTPVHLWRSFCFLLNQHDYFLVTALEALEGCVLGL